MKKKNEKIDASLTTRPCSCSLQRSLGECNIKYSTSRDRQFILIIHNEKAVSFDQSRDGRAENARSFDISDADGALCAYRIRYAQYAYHGNHDECANHVNHALITLNILNIHYGTLLSLNASHRILFLDPFVCNHDIPFCLHRAGLPLFYTRLL